MNDRLQAARSTSSDSSTSSDEQRIGNANSPVAIVGGGLAGLTAATILARAGQSVTLYERSPTMGGRALTHTKAGYHFNLGPHALYCAGPGVRILKRLGIRFSGTKPVASGAYALDGGTKHALPGGFFSLVTTSLLRLPAKIETARLLGSITKIDTAPIQSVTISDWLQSRVRQPDVRRLVLALVRVATYANDPERMSAGSALDQIRSALTVGVQYLDGGWQTLVDGLQEAARAAGVTFETGVRVAAVEAETEVHGVRLADGSVRPASTVIIAGAPGTAAELLSGTAGRTVRPWAEAAIPIKAACLDIGLASLPQPRARFALGIDRPLYLSVHSAYARLAPDGGATIHVAKYLNPAEPSDPKSDERELEGALDLVQPGWRDVIVARRFLPNMIVSNALPTATSGGTGGRPGPAVPGVRGLYVCGDWVGTDALLADTSFASAERAAALALAQGTATATAAAA